VETRTKFLKRKDETFDCTSFIFEKPSSFEYIAGQYMFFTVEHENPDSRGPRRHFTISSSPTENEIMFTTRFTNQGSSYKKALRELKTGTSVTIANPSGKFILPKDPSQPVVFLGGGIGITPFRSMIKFATDKLLPTPINLIYSNKTPTDIVYRTEFDLWSSTNHHLRVHYLVDLPDSNWNGDTGHLNSEIVKRNVPDLTEPIFYICGPPGMVAAYKDLLEQAEVQIDSIHTENFSGY
jgi:glycine betaine catabolism B